MIMFLHVWPNVLQLLKTQVAPALMLPAVCLEALLAATVPIASYLVFWRTRGVWPEAVHWSALARGRSLPLLLLLPLPESVETTRCVYFFWVAFAFSMFAVA